ncbi:AimR family lysis-lysogeny pheromone receptor [Bacillus sp. FDAARGOS_1420]|uniref:AimR family lysis-lysogeny pheromone receptor n=1 Tax=unclassified Bacillus (in: firmicutes) TaxID=185979 RepID=UPI001C5B01B7|nr:AimR family lysis-lysogeny pheromone receptor [Bacillus sp. FDAARGOS_1420]MBW3490612.1 AimR family lysis-lysogeny pheromone receptor [Bacillus sp. FDAARGOS_1420]
MRFHQKICDLIEDKEDLTLTIVAEKIGVPLQYMSKFKNQGAISFCHLVKLSYVLNDSEKSPAETMADWCLQLDTAEAIKQSFEYAALTRNVELLKQLILKYKEDNGTVREYAVFYNILYRYITSELHGTKIIDELNKVGQPKDKVLSILVDIMKCYNYFHLKKYHVMLELAQEIENQVIAIESERKFYIKACYVYRVIEVFAPVYLHYNCLGYAEKFAKAIIEANVSKKTISDAYYILGMSHLAKDQTKSLQYFQTSYDLMKTINDIELQTESRYNLDLAKVYFGVKLENDSDLDLIEFQNNPCIENISKLKEVLYDGREGDFLVYFIGVASQQHRDLHNIFTKFLSQSNYLFASLTAKELYARGEEYELIETMIQINGDVGKEVLSDEEISSYGIYGINGIHNGEWSVGNKSGKPQTADL